MPNDDLAGPAPAVACWTCSAAAGGSARTAAWTWTHRQPAWFTTEVTQQYLGRIKGMLTQPIVIQ